METRLLMTTRLIIGVGIMSPRVNRKDCTSLPTTNPIMTNGQPIARNQFRRKTSIEGSTYRN